MMMFLHNIMNLHLKTETFENEDLSGDFEIRAGKMHENSCVNSKTNTW